MMTTVQWEESFNGSDVDLISLDNGVGNKKEALL
jgi:hypothetical protein